jgi:hypothetical protein
LARHRFKRTQFPADMGNESYSRRLWVLSSAAVRLIFTPITAGLGAARHITWYVKYQVTGETRASEAS